MMSLKLMNHRCGRAGTRSISPGLRFLVWCLRSRLFTQHSPACAGWTEQEVHCTGSVGPASAKGLNSSFMAFLSQAQVFLEEQMGPMWPHSSPALGYHLFLSRYPRTVVETSLRTMLLPLKLFTSAQAATSSHFTCYCLARQWHTDFNLFFVSL